MRERAWRRIRGEAARLAERDREEAERERRVNDEEEAVARRAHRVIPDTERDSPPTDAEGQLSSTKMTRGEGGKGGQARGKRRQVEEQGPGEATGAPQPNSPSPEPTPTDWGSESQRPRRCARHLARRVPGTVRGWRPGDMAELSAT